MTRHVTLEEVKRAHTQLLRQSGGGDGVRDAGMLDSAVARPRSFFGGRDLYPTLEAKAAALCHSLVLNHPFVDGNKRIGHHVMWVFLRLNGLRLVAPIDEAEALILRLAAGGCELEELEAWVHAHVVPIAPGV